MAFRISERIDTFKKAEESAELYSDCPCTDRMTLTLFVDENPPYRGTIKITGILKRFHVATRLCGREADKNRGIVFFPRFHALSPPCRNPPLALLPSLLNNVALTSVKVTEDGVLTIIVPTMRASVFFLLVVMFEPSVL
ncbi:hypothetical protein QZH47_16385 [Pseudomonas corrugata]